MLLIILIVAVVDCCEVSLVQYNSTFQYTIDGDYKHTEWKYNDSLIICSDGLVYKQFNSTVKCDNLSLEFDALNVTFAHVIFECKTINGSSSTVTFNVTAVSLEPSVSYKPLGNSPIPSTKRLYYYLPLALTPLVWYTVLLIYYVDLSG